MSDSPPPDRSLPGPLVEPLALSVSYRVGEAEVGFSIADRRPEDPWFYRRWGNPSAQALADRLAALEGGAGAVVFSTGMAAMTGLLLHRLSAGDRLVLSDVCYPGVAELAHQTLARLGIEVEAVDQSRADEVLRALERPARHVHLEIPANPLLRLADLREIAAAAHAAGAQVSVDSTIASPVGLRPLALGADWVVHSLTKYASGHGDALGGVVVGADRAALGELDSEASAHFGASLSPLDAHLIGRGLSTLELRVERQMASALEVARWLEGDERVDRVLHPLLPSHPEHGLVERLGLRGCGLVSFVVADPAAVAARARTGMGTVSWAVSLGHERSLMYLVDTDGLVAGSYRFGPGGEDRYRALAPRGLFRLSVGLEPPEAILADIERVLGG